MLVFTFLLSYIFTQAQTAAEKYIEQFDSLAIEVLQVYGIPASIVLGVALQESGAGTSKLCRVNKNHFGVKARVKSSQTKSGYAWKYRSFESDEAAYLHFGQMLAKKKYYSSLKGNMDYMKWLKAMKAANYATSPQWISHVDKMIKRYSLTRFDNPVPFPFLPAPAVPDSILINYQ
jgi:flagellum-specific peptidoglycan hydrolase FlgJ